jgi:GNAT superfamily N-acetyltransferase
VNWYFEITTYWYFHKAKQRGTLWINVTTGTDMPAIYYSDDRKIAAAQLADVFKRSGIRRPVDDLPRMARMLEHGNLLVTAWDGEILIGVARALTDFSYCCYLSDLAVDERYQKQGIGRTLTDRVRAAIGEQSMLLLLAAPEAMAYYPKIGFNAVDNGWIIKRST